jgi:hypothetical protein
VNRLLVNLGDKWVCEPDSEAAITEVDTVARAFVGVQPLDPHSLQENP